MIRFLILAVAAIAPWLVRRQILAWLCQASFGRGAYVGQSFVDTRRLVLGDDARIGSLNCFRHVREIKLEAKASIGNLNWFSGASHKTESDLQGNYTSGNLIMHEGAAITNRHYVDMHGHVEIGPMSLLAGVRSTLLTHSIDFKECHQQINDIWIGAFSFVGTNSVLLPGAYVPEKCVVGAGAVVTGRFDETGCLYGGVPAKLVKKLPIESLRFFDRTDPFVE